MVGAAEEGGYYCDAQGTYLFQFILYGMEVEINHEEIVFIIAFQSYASIPPRTKERRSCHNIGSPNGLTVHANL